MSAPKLCRDCKWIRVTGKTPGTMGWFFAACTHPKVSSIDLVSGEQEAITCREARAGHICGEAAVYWEPSPIAPKEDQNDDA